MIGIREIAVVAEGEPAELEIGEERLHVAQRDLARRRVAHMADGARSRQTV